MTPPSKPLSKTVQRRQLKRMRPRHYEILTRYSRGQNQRTIAAAMGIGEQWLSVLINSPVFQEELRKRWEVEEQARIKRLAEREQKRIDAVANMMRYGVGDPAILDQPSIFDHWKPKRNNHDDDAEGLGDLMVKAINRSRRKTQWEMRR